MILWRPIASRDLGRLRWLLRSFSQGMINVTGSGDSNHCSPCRIMLYTRLKWVNHTKISLQPLPGEAKMPANGFRTS